MRALLHSFVATLLAFVASGPAVAAAGRHHGAHHTPVRLVQLGDGGTLIRVHVDDRRTFVLSREEIAAAVVRDVDADGDLDILANTAHGLVLWRNVGQNQYVLANPARRTLTRRAGSGLAPSRQTSLGSGFGEQRQQFAAQHQALPARGLPLAPSPCQQGTFIRSSACRTYAGRAPPVNA
ncbi:MAG TPA: VCBS repeat-containing protein [Vicinamibacterales bacterium]|nr:VCBS repeat-containing protein [Vicinamibacterales bacterium]